MEEIQERTLLEKDLMLLAGYQMAMLELVLCPICNNEMQILQDVGVGSKSICEMGHIITMNVLMLNN